jgi:Flp pilus assembly protein TadG
VKRRFFKNERGAATVQFAIVAVLLITILFGIIEIGVLVYDNHVLTNASREGARAGVVMRNPRLTDQNIIDAVNRYAQQYMVTFGTSNPLTTIITPAEGSRNSFGTELTVKVEYEFDFLVLSIVGLGHKTLKAETRMRME